MLSFAGVAGEGEGDRGRGGVPVLGLPDPSVMGGGPWLGGLNFGG